MKDKVLDWADRFQQRHPWLGFPFAVVKKFGEDQGGQLAAVLSYYAFFSLFPLLLVFVTLTGFVLSWQPEWRTGVVETVVGNFPFLRPEDVDALDGHLVGLLTGLGFALWSGLAIANTAQAAFDSVHDVPYVERRGFLPRLGRSVVVVAVGFLLLTTTLVGGFVTGAGALGFAPPGVLRVTAALVVVVIDVALFTFLFRWLTSRAISWRDALPGALLAGVAFYALQLTATALFTNFVTDARETYGAFATVIGVLSWFYLQARITLLAAELNVVRRNRLWPRALVPPPVTEADRRVYRRQAEQQRWRPEEQIEARYDDETARG